MLFGSFPILVLLRLLRQLCRVRYYVRDKLTEALGVLRGDNGLARFGFQRVSRHTRDIAAAAGDLLIFVKALRLLGLLCCVTTCDRLCISLIEQHCTT